MPISFSSLSGGGGPQGYILEPGTKSYSVDFPAGIYKVTSDNLVTIFDGNTQVDGTQEYTVSGGLQSIRTIQETDDSTFNQVSVGFNEDACQIVKGDIDGTEYIVVVESFGNNLAYSTDGGETFTTITAPRSDTYGVSIGNNTVVISFYNGSLYTWNETDGFVSRGNPTGQESVRTLNYFLGGKFIVGYRNNMAAWSDDGITWNSVRAIPSGITNDIRGIRYREATGQYFFYGKNPWIGESNGVTTNLINFSDYSDSGITGNEQNDSYDYVRQASNVVAQDESGENAMIGWQADGVIYVSITKNGGGSWTRASITGAASCYTDGYIWIALGNGRLYVSRDGSSWTNRSFIAGDYNHATFTAGKIIIARNKYSQVYASTPSPSSGASIIVTPAEIVGG